jgi:hypothetical protein
MADETEPSDMAGSTEEEPTIPARGPARRGHRIITVVAAVCLVGGGIGAAVAVTGGPSGSSTPASAVNNLLAAANHSDLIGVLDAIVPGERTAIEPGMLGLVAQLERLDVLSHNTNLKDVGGLSLHFAGIKTATTMLSSNVAAVAITGGTVTGAFDATSLPVGSFVSRLTRGRLSGNKQSSTSPVTTGREAIVTEQVNGTWYVSLGYTVAYDALRSAGRPATPPPTNEAVSATGSSTPEGAVATLLNDAMAFNLRGVIGDLPPGEMGALQSYAPLFLGKADQSLEKARSEVATRITHMSLSGSPIAGGTLVKVSDLGLSATVEGITLTYKGGCLTYSYLGRSVRRCPSLAVTRAAENKLISVLPRSLRGLATRLMKDRPSFGFVTVQDNGRWFVSPVATMLDALNGTLSILQPQDLEAIASLAENPAELHALGTSLEKVALGALASGSSTF